MCLLLALVLIGFFSFIFAAAVNSTNEANKAGSMGTQAVYVTQMPMVTAQTMEQRTFKNVNNYQNTNIYSYLETSGGQNYNLYLYQVRYLNIRQFKKGQTFLTIDQNFDHQMSLSKSKCWYSNNCLHFVNRAVSFTSPCSHLTVLHLQNFEQAMFHEN